MNKKYVIIGASAAGIAAAGKLRQLDKDCEITCITSQKNLPYNKCLLVDYLSGEIEKEKLILRSPYFFEENRIKLILNTSVENIIPEKNQIKLSDNQEINYNNLFIATGTSPIIPEITGLNKDDIFTFHTLCDVLKILDFIKENTVKTATVIGGGLSGIECCDALTALNIKVNLILKNTCLLSSALDEKASNILEKEMQENIVNIYKNELIQEVTTKEENSKKIFNLKFASGKALQSDLVIFAVGCKPNIELIKNTEIKIQNNAILTNEFMQTNIPNIYAGGDVCLVKDLLTQEYIRSCTWPDAVMQGMAAGSNMVGKEKKYSEILLTVSSNVFDTTFVSCGIVNPTSKDCKVIIKEDSDFYHKFLVQDGYLLGFLMFGKIDNVGKLKNMILTRTKFE